MTPTNRLIGRPTSEHGPVYWPKEQRPSLAAGRLAALRIAEQRKEVK
jgi:hypothetical protein